jgi:DNA polymerase-1
VSSYRSSSADPNFQNFPIRLPRLAVLRTAFVPRNDWLMEIDFSGAEVRAYAVNTQDRTLISHIRNNVDYHRHYAALLYEKPEDEITKEERYKGKNGFIFPEFYGDVADSIARSNPQWRRERIREVEKIFWGDLPFVKKWQNETWTFYKKHGFVKYLNGFVVRLGKEGMLSYNQCCNLPNQGLAFHRLLECLLKQEIAMREAGLVSTIIGQIHDSVVIDVVDGEVDRVIELAEPTIRTPVWGFDSIVPWGADIKIGRNLLAMEKV